MSKRDDSDPTPDGAASPAHGGELDWIRAARREVEAIEDSAAPVEGVPAEAQASALDTEPGEDEIAGYRIRQRLDAGGQGVVYRAEQSSTGRRVAIKFVRQGSHAGADEAARFQREVRILGQIQHPGIVTIHDSGTARSGHYFVMDYIQGEPLDVWAANPNRSRESVVESFIAIAEAVNAAHVRGIIHRDLKPSNVRVDGEGRPFVLDFGLAKVSSVSAEASVMTTTGQFLGSLPWASPEQVSGDPLATDTRSDVYSLGVMLYQVLAGRFPYEVQGPFVQVVERILNASPASLRDSDVDDELETIVFKCLAKEAERRYQTAGELGRDLRRYLDREPIEAKRDSALYLARKLMSKYRVPTFIGSSFLVAGFTFGVAMTALYRNAEAQARTAEASAAEARELLDRYGELVSALEPYRVDSGQDDLETVMEKATGARDTLRSFSEDAMQFIVDYEAIGPDYVRFQDATAPRLTGEVMHVGEEGDHATLEEAWKHIESGMLVVLSEGRHEVESNSKRPLEDVAIVGQGIGATSLTLTLEDAKRVRLQDMTIDCQDDEFIDLDEGSAQVQRCLVRNYNSGAGGSNAVFGKRCVLLFEDCEFNGEEGRASSPNRYGDAFDLRGSYMVYARGCTFIKNSEILRVDGLAVFDRCSSDLNDVGTDLSLYPGGVFFQRDVRIQSIRSQGGAKSIRSFRTSSDEPDFVFEGDSPVRRSPAYWANLLAHDDERVRQWAEDRIVEHLREAIPSARLESLPARREGVSLEELEASWARRALARRAMRTEGR